MKAKLVSMFALLALGACAGTPETPANFDASACYERAFDIYFERYEDQLNAPAREAIDTVQNQLRGCRIDSVRVLGLAGAAGGSRENFDLSARRALYIAEYMEREPGWSQRNFQTVAAGEAGAVTETGEVEPMRRVARITVRASDPGTPAPAAN
ncbi:MAG TPA: OmpA family protein [Verrucomicrobiae bacterium]|nr:OmpA family protein [Verrucomicrobiae bacterium]